MERVDDQTVFGLLGILMRRLWIPQLTIQNAVFGKF
jgi:hypothetical protein